MEHPGIEGRDCRQSLNWCPVLFGGQSPSGPDYGAGTIMCDAHRATDGPGVSLFVEYECHVETDTRAMCPVEMPVTSLPGTSARVASALEVR